MAILLFLLRLIGWVLLAVLLLLLVALLIPLGVRFAYRPGSVRAMACYGPLHFTLWPRKGQPEALKKPASAAPPGQTPLPPPFPCPYRRTAAHRIWEPVPGKRRSGPRLWDAFPWSAPTH